MIETALVFALGALASGILALLLLPAFTRRAARLARRDVEAELPRSLDEIAAMRDGVRAEYAARTARVEAALAAANRTLTDERLTKADMSIQLAALRTERRAYDASLGEAEARISAAFAELRDREEALARALAENRDMHRQVAHAEDQRARAEARVADLERVATELRVSLLSAESRAMALSDAYIARTGLVLPEPDEAGAAAPQPVVIEGTVNGVTMRSPFPSGYRAGADPADAIGNGEDTDDEAAAAAADELVEAEPDFTADDDGEPRTAPAPSAPAPAQAAPTTMRVSLDPALAADLAERLRSVRRRARPPEQAPRKEPQGPALPVAAAWSFPVGATLEPGEPEAERDAPPVATAASPERTPRKRGEAPPLEPRFPKVTRRFPEPGEPRFEPVLTTGDAESSTAPVPVVSPRDKTGVLPDEDEEAEAALPESFVKQPVPVVTRGAPTPSDRFVAGIIGSADPDPPGESQRDPRRRKPRDAWERLVAGATSGDTDDAEDDPQGPAEGEASADPGEPRHAENPPAAVDRPARPERKPPLQQTPRRPRRDRPRPAASAEETPATEERDGEADGREPATTGPTYTFPALAAPALTPGSEPALAPELRDRRMEELAARLRTLRSRQGPRKPDAAAPNAPADEDRRDDAEQESEAALAGLDGSNKPAAK